MSESVSEKQEQLVDELVALVKSHPELVEEVLEACKVRKAELEARDE